MATGPALTAPWSTVAKLQQHTEHPSTDEWVADKWGICAWGYYSSFKEKENVSFATPWKRLGKIKVRENSQHREAEPLFLLCQWNLLGKKKTKLIKSEGRIWWPQMGGMGCWDLFENVVNIINYRELTLHFNITESFNYPHYKKEMRWQMLINLI